MKKYTCVIDVITHGDYCAGVEGGDACPFVMTIYQDNDAEYPKLASCAFFKKGLDFESSTSYIPNRCFECFKEFDGCEFCHSKEH